MKLLTNTITILAEIAAMILSIIWYSRTLQIEPLIGIIVSGSSFIVSVLMKFANRPRIVMHHTWTHSGRNPRGYTVNNPPVIYVGINNPQMYWRLSWNYRLEIRNNSSFTAYNIRVKYVNLPDKTFIEGEFGKIEPFQTHETREFRVKLIQNVTGTHIDADNYLENNPAILTETFKIQINYTDEYGFPFSTTYHWTKDDNRFKLLH
ncbi:hypothetical protein EFY79_18325 [Hanamia caeni]|uniref:Uncharacterized protein n=1 Tax=Hanamia caeni TaxID=2294116 RepID=A0A3M9N741_9BACT|nr:hypothetical protein [Hanamia caeni]RNI33579.1 hypothetical protein EFY79_18325 [Hanamia caeni]